jgi:hypothetical protein
VHDFDRVIDAGLADRLVDLVDGDVGRLLAGRPEVGQIA